MSAPGSFLRLGRWIALLLLPTLAFGQKYYTYVGHVTSDSVLLAWGTTEAKGNTIGRHSHPHGKALARLGDREVITEKQNWAVIDKDVRSGMEAANIAGWAPQRHFLLVEIEAAIMRITPLGDGPIRVVGPQGHEVRMPLQVRLSR